MESKSSLNDCCMCFKPFHLRTCPTAIAQKRVAQQEQELVDLEVRTNDLPTVTRPGVFPSDASKRNEFPMFDGLLAYFPSALAEVARVSKIGNDQHNPGEPMHWARGKSTDHKNKVIRHVMDDEHEPVDTDGTLHLAKAAWRVLAALQVRCEQMGAPLAPAARPIIMGQHATK